MSKIPIMIMHLPYATESLILDRILLIRLLCESELQHNGLTPGSFKNCSALKEILLVLEMFLCLVYFVGGNSIVILKSKQSSEVGRHLSSM